MRRNLIIVLSEGVFQVHWLGESECWGYIGPVEFTAVLRESSLELRCERTPCPISVALSKTCNILGRLPHSDLKVGNFFDAKM